LFQASAFKRVNLLYRYASALPDLTESLPMMQCKKGSIITSQGDHGDMVWFIKRWGCTS
jgi:hypothetical protein